MPIVVRNVLCVAGGVLAIALLSGVSKTHETEFKAVCTKQGGEPAYNGREYVCLKGK